MTRPRAISLFSGAGGLDLGFCRAGFDVVAAFETNAAARKTYEHNFGLVANPTPVEQWRPGPRDQAAVVFGGPPCQGFSSSGKRDPTDPRSLLIFEPLRVAAAVGADAVVIENVAAVAEVARWRSLREDLFAFARSLDLHGEFYVLNAARYGVPQARRRMFFIAFRRPIKLDFESHESDEMPTLRTAIGALPRLGTLGNDQPCTARIVPAPKPVLRKDPYGGGLFFNGSGRVLAPDQPARTLPASMGGNATHIIDEAELFGGEPPWIRWYHRHLVNGGKPARLVPDFLRRLSVAEAAALQTFPSGFEFLGSRNSRFSQIGNAVPPMLGEAVARRIRDALGYAPTSTRVDSSRQNVLVAP